MTAAAEDGAGSSAPPALMPLIDYHDVPEDGPAERLAASLRALLDAAVTSDAGGAEQLEVAAAVDALTLRLSGEDGGRLNEGMPWPPVERMRRGDRPYNVILGRAHPMAPPMQIRVCDDGSVMSELTMRPIHEGPAGFVHGGWVAALLDQLLGSANIVSGHPAMTGELTIRYHRGTPFGIPLVLRARTDSVQGRRVHASGEITVAGEVTAAATGLFILPTPERVAEIRRVAGGRASDRTRDGGNGSEGAPA
jgi:acyl-coenzyme A thioesterase PaaI-like protein